MGVMHQALTPSDANLSDATVLSVNVFIRKHRNIRKKLKSHLALIWLAMNISNKRQIAAAGEPFL